jgi:hypothetical protein
MQRAGRECTMSAQHELAVLRLAVPEVERFEAAARKERLAVANPERSS